MAKITVYQVRDNGAKVKITFDAEEKENIYLLLKTRLQELLKYKKIDFIDFTSGITKMELRVLENIITII